MRKSEGRDTEKNWREGNWTAGRKETGKSDDVIIF